MNTFFEYLTLSLWVFPFYFYVISFLHLRNKINPGVYFGYSAKGQLIMGIASTFFASSFLFQSVGVNATLMFSYCATLIWATRVEKQAKIGKS